MVKYNLHQISTQGDNLLSPVNDELGTPNGFIDISITQITKSDFLNKLFYFKVDDQNNYSKYTINTDVYTKETLYKNILMEHLVPKPSLPGHTSGGTIMDALLEQMAIDLYGNNNIILFNNIPAIKNSINSSWYAALSKQRNVMSNNTQANSILEQLITTASVYSTSNPKSNPIDNNYMNGIGWRPFLFQEGDSMSFNLTFNSPLISKPNRTNIKYRFTLNV